MAMKPRTAIIIAACAAAAVVLALWKPTVLINGIREAGLYASIAIPMGLVLGIVHIVNLAHGEFMMLAAYFGYLGFTYLGVDPLLSIVPTAAVTAAFGFVIYKMTIRRSLQAPELNQLILTFGLGITLSQAVNLIFTSQTRKLSLEYSSASMTIGELSFGIWPFVFMLAAGAMAIGLRLYLTKTVSGKAALAVGQNPRGAAIVGIDVDRVYGSVFAMASALIGGVGALFLTKASIFPGVGSPFTMKSFCLIAMAGVGNIPGILAASVLLGISEQMMRAFRGLRGWADIIFFVLIIAVILGRTVKGRKG